jgi:DNA-binding transcriptional ArsR family regulator
MKQATTHATKKKPRRDVFRAVADPTRREIIKLLSVSTLNMQDIAEHFAMSRPAVAKHIKILAESGCLIVARQGRESVCVLQATALKELHDWSGQYERFWSQKLQGLDEYLSGGL